MSRERNLIKNTGILAVGQLSSKLFTFLLLPVYTSLLLPEDFGTVDALQTVISLVLYVVTLQLESAVFRFIIDDRNNKENERTYISSAFFAILIMAGASTLIILLVDILFNIPHLALFILSIWVQSIYFFVSNVARGMGRNIDYSITSFIVTFISLIINIVFIVFVKFGASSILFALIGSNIFGILYLSIRLNIWYYIDIRSFETEKLKTMLCYSVPLIPNAISWWIANTSDRLIIIIYLGSTMNGIYAAANRIPTIYTTIFSVFNLAWSESVSLAMKDNDNQEYINSMIENSFRFFSFVNLGITICMSLLFNLLIGDSYADAYNHIYILLIAIFINSMCSLLGGILTGLKDSKAIGWTTVSGAFVNFLINICLIQNIGLYAASISTLVSYVVIFVCRYFAIKRHMKIAMPYKFTLKLFPIFICVTFAYFYKSRIISLGVLMILCIWGCYYNQKIIAGIFKEIKRKTASIIGRHK